MPVVAVMAAGTVMAMEMEMEMEMETGTETETETEIALPLVLVLVGETWAVLPMAMEAVEATEAMEVLVKASGAHSILEWEWASIKFFCFWKHTWTRPEINALVLCM
ncbi:hypothetical protein EDD16DRAFT_1676388 [Pisolithus croceorrhizus]|nr:hypothetical protein EDD16DRAFT_1676388 [Pisolithus croceorrhizus]